jgi:hypothetical protein
MAVFDLSPEKQQEWTRKYREAAAPYVDGEIEAVGQFRRQVFWLFAIPVIGEVGLLIYMAVQALLKKRAGGLPENFLLVVTSDKVHALKSKPAGFNIKVQGEVGVFDRADVKVQRGDRGGPSTGVTLEVTENGETESIKIAADQLERNPWTREVLELLER